MHSSRNILIIPSWYPPDGGYFFKEHSEAIQNMGWQVDVLVNRVVGVRKLIQLGTKAFRRSGMHDENGLRVWRTVYLKIPGREKHNIRAWTRKTLRLYKRYERSFGKPGLILAHSVTWAGVAASLIREKYGIPYVIVEHRSFFVWSTENARRMVKPYYLPFFEQAYQHCARLVLVSGSLLTGLKTLMPWIEEKTMVIPNMIREDLFQLPHTPRAGDPFVFFWGGRLEHVKGIDLLLKAVRLLGSRKTNPFIVRLAGRGSLRAELEDLSRELEVDARVSFLGRISREAMEKELQEANCFILPSRYEAFGAVLIEAMATGLPVIATRSGGPDHIVTEENGVLIDPDREDQLADAMEQMILSHGKFNAVNIRESALKNYGQTNIMEQYNRLFNQMMLQ